MFIMYLHKANKSALNAQHSGRLAKRVTPLTKLAPSAKVLESV